MHCSWMKKRETQALRTWSGYAFEQVYLSHIGQIKDTVQSIVTADDLIFTLTK